MNPRDDARLEAQGGEEIADEREAKRFLGVLDD
jgi:hypothetical protein